MACGEQLVDDDDEEEEDEEMEVEEVSELRTREEELRLGCEELQEELQSVGDGGEKSSATFCRELERDCGGGGCGEDLTSSSGHPDRPLW